MGSRGRIGRNKDKKEEDPTVILKRKFRAKCRFKSIVRLALANAYWLLEVTEQYEGDDVKMRVAQAVRGKPKKKQLLKLSDKQLLNKPAADRTDSEKRYLYRIIGGLKCFKRYPSNVKKKLAALTYFQYYGPNRVIVRQHQEAHALYFIVSGEVMVTHLVYDGLLNLYEPVEIGIMHAGDMFGEVSLLHSIPRTATCTTLSHCELLLLKREDFKYVLLATLQKSWDEVRLAMSYFTYFDALDEVARREGCIMAKMKSYEENDIILGDGQGVPNFVYFILSGCCQMIDSLHIIIHKQAGRTFYTLYDPYVASAEAERNLDDEYFGALMNIRSNSTITDHRLSSSTGSSNSSTGSTFKVLDSILKIPVQKSNISVGKRVSHVIDKHNRGSKHVNDVIKSNNNSEMPSKISSYATEIPRQRTSSLKTRELLPPTNSTLRESVRFSVESKPVFPGNYKTYFMQVCQFKAGSTFGFGENMRDRRIVALNHVECMLLPKVWLMQRNTANIWTRIRHYLDTKIPNKRQLFEKFLEERRWEEYRDQVVEDVVTRSNTVNWTSVHDVPYSIRMEEMLDV